MTKSARHQVVAPPPRFATTRLTEPEYWAYVRFAAELDVTPARFLRRALREAMGQGPDPLRQEFAAVLEAAAQVSAIGRNLNQLVRKVNAREVVGGDDLKSVLEGILPVTHALEARLDDLLSHARDRRVRDA